MLRGWPLFVHALSPLHAGTGQGVGIIDLPVARERATGLPYLPGSSLKGVLRDACKDPDVRRRLFGPDTAEASEHAGSVVIGDQKLLLFPVRSLWGTFAWATSPFVLRRLRRDLELAEIAKAVPDVPEPASVDEGLVATEEAAIVGKMDPPSEGAAAWIVLEDLDLMPRFSEESRGWATWLAERLFPGDPAMQAFFGERFLVVHDDLFGYLLDTATEVEARVRLDSEFKTVVEGGLWYEEALPTESVLSGMLLAMPVKAEADEVLKTVEALTQKPLQLGGKATVGRGLCRVRVVKS
ncbi:type III-B CRISPR module RAMP protein Cmr4 [Hydrogenibacillus sp. N12]|uniref:type III-B CRISPR module RAMP protein Cmr4 n=1 Tax=Hydrogenibacillus sp. N12 TaxID=2866627 RepID=UPI001C7DDE6A|nr:type III-B CRISPR module RAMP protein Cmr4 [Hydrogenibacillus sp. N12]QZA33218.1 type III-B CRISPR module RAMP protein Cmr4 [Hydrogenibacillus sp. N12]